MKSIRIYHPGQFETGQAVHLDRSASHHLLRVLRLKNQQAFILFNGEGREYSAQLEISGKTAIAHIETSHCVSNESHLKIHLLQGVSKGERMDFAIQKSIELGVNRITPIICERTVVNLKGERQNKKLQHWQNLAISTCEQCGRNILPEVSPIKPLTDALQNNEEGDCLKLLLDPLSQLSLNSIETRNHNITLLIGPEGGLSENEIAQAGQNDFNGVQLGPRVLRTETAALAAITALQVLWGDLG
ncbi:16S rRNA (uracil(1498)-N(3))-methyltransferase [hydrothermal vent metagenome]|uniref:16S rRNA (uracil(1498)-N(3))-methyltransferase n=1 Tax=hydrothermal vent metagenome TaxID=652676 RepID=A0A3B0XMA6_9ZZZZ